jgi:hypothetical protein
VDAETETEDTIEGMLDDPTPAVPESDTTSILHSNSDLYSRFEK